MMFRNMIGVETRLVISLDELEACLVIILQRQVAAVQMVEYTKFHGSDQVPFAIVVGNLMRFVGESTGYVRMCYSATRKLRFSKEVTRDSEWPSKNNLDSCARSSYCFFDTSLEVSGTP